VNQTAIYRSATYGDLGMIGAQCPVIKSGAGIFRTLPQNFNEVIPVKIFMIEQVRSIYHMKTALT